MSQGHPEPRSSWSSPEAKSLCKLVQPLPSAEAELPRVRYSAGALLSDAQPADWRLEMLLAIIGGGERLQSYSQLLSLGLRICFRTVCPIDSPIT